MAPTNTPPETVDKLQKATLAALTPDLRERLARTMLDVVALPSDQFRKKMRAESAANKVAIGRIGLKLQ